MGSNTSGPREVQAVLDGVRRIVHTLRESSRRAEKAVGVSGAQLFVLQRLAEATTPLSVNQLAARTHTHQSSVSTVATRLVESGFVRRTRSGADGRSVELSLTAKGRRLSGRSPGLAQDSLVRAVQQLPAARRRALALSLGELARAMDASASALAAAPAMFFEESTRRSKGRRHV